MEIIVENKEYFLHLINDFYKINNDLSDLMCSLESDPSLSSYKALNSKIKNLAAEVQLMDVKPLLSILDPLSLISSQLANYDNDSASKQAFEFIRSFFSLLEQNFSNWKKDLELPDTQTPKRLECKVDLGLLEEVHAFNSIQLKKDKRDASFVEVEMSGDMITKVIKEGRAHIAVMRAELLRADSEKGGVEQLRIALSMFKGGCDVLIESDFNNLSSDHIIHKITRLLNWMIKICDLKLQKAELLTDAITHLFESCFDKLEDLFNDFKDSKSTDEDINSLITALEDLYNALLGAEKSKEDKQDKISTGNVSSEQKPKQIPKKEDTFLPIKLSRIEDLGDLVGELVVAKNAFNNLKLLINQADKQKTQEFFKKTEDGFHRIISDLDSVVMKMRMQGAKSLFQRFPRMVRDLSKKMGKQIDLTFFGEEIEIDSRILNVIADPLMHLVRNSLDHGLETPEAREKAGKSAKGSLTLSVKNYDGRTIIEIHDDGKGIDPEIIKKKVVEKELLQQSELDRMSHNEIRELIFLPGFSTVETVTEVSGRGVGMDVVMDNISSINGTISIESETGKFTKMILSLPLTISVSKGLKICFENDMFLIPMDNVLKMTSLNKGDIHNTKDASFVQIDDSIYPLLPTSSLLGYKSPIESTQEGVSMIVVKNGNQKACIAVDKIVGIEDIVVRPLPDLYANSDNSYSGCTILSDGNVILILNVKF